MRDYRPLHYPEVAFGGYTDVDGTVAFHLRVNSLLSPDSVLLDYGCGRGEYKDEPVPTLQRVRTYHDKCKKVVGLDVDPVGQENPFIHEFHLLEGPTWPVPDESVDVIVSDWVLEHLEDPKSFFSECNRVLVPGGFVCLRTPNKWSYFGWIARLIPDRLHARVLTRVHEGRKEEDVFPKYYRANSIWSIRRFLRKLDFEHCVYGFESAPSYLSFSRIAYFLSVLHQRFAPKFLKVNIFAFGRKPG